uniref:EGF-like domain-containing protein n=1 Tax=Heterorhabditis bacteriophora TaxID=37862 RepID=A0A1I7WB69_HETBA
MLSISIAGYFLLTVFEDVNECEYGYCAHGICINMVSSLFRLFPIYYICNATTLGSYRCDCFAGFVGVDCQILATTVNCTLDGSMSCQNGGICKTENEDYTCKCLSTFEVYVLMVVAVHSLILIAKQYLSGDVVIVVLSDPIEFIQLVNKFLMTLSVKLRATRVPVPNNQVGDISKNLLAYDGTYEIKSSILCHLNRFILSTLFFVFFLWRISIFSCYCYLQDFSDLGMPIFEAFAHRPNPPTQSASSLFAFTIGCLAIMIVIATVFILQQRTRKRRIVEATSTWCPPKETAELNARGPYGRTPVMWLADNKSNKTELDLVEDLHRLRFVGADLNIQDDLYIYIHLLILL